MRDCILFIVAKPELEEVIVDWVLEQYEISGFTSNPIYGNSREQRKLSVVEQVIGRQRSVMFHIHVKNDVLDSVIMNLREKFEGTGIEYWVIPVTLTGRL